MTWELLSEIQALLSSSIMNCQGTETNKQATTEPGSLTKVLGAVAGKELAPARMSEQALRYPRRHSARSQCRRRGSSWCRAQPAF